jgi:polysaccharide biosynthesis transport protein
MPKPSAAPKTVEFPFEGSDQRDRLPLLQGLEIVRRRRSLIVMAGALGLFVGLAYLLVAPPQYTAAARLATETRRAHAVPTSSEAVVDQSVIESQIEMIRSEKLSLAVIRKLGLENDPEFVGAGRLGRLMERIGLGDRDQAFAAAVRERRALDHFDRSLSVAQIGRSYIADIRFTASEPAKAARIANAVAESYIDDQLDALTSGASRAGSWIEQRLEELRRQADEAASALEAFKSANGITGAKAGTLADETQSRLRTLEAAAASYRHSYEIFQNLNRYSQNSQEQALPATEARVVSEALPPVSRSAPKTGVTLLLSLLMGCGLGAVLAIGREYFDHAVRDRHQLESELGIKCLGCLPLLSGRNVITNWHRRILKSRASFLRLRRPPPDRMIALFKQDRSHSHAGEILINIRVAIDARGHGSACRVIGITSARGHEGKTTLAVNLADSIADAGKRVLLIDGDLRGRSLTRLLAFDSTCGLSDALAHDLVLSDLLPCRNFSFHLLPQPLEQVTKCPPDLLSSEAMRELLAQAGKSYDYVIIDLPAALDYVDVPTMAGLIDAFVLVTEWQHTPMRELEQVLQASSLVSQRLVGAVINKVEGNSAHVRRAA